jgi:hypothetical protein
MPKIICIKVYLPNSKISTVSSFATNTRTMDGPEHEQGAKNQPFQDLLYSPSEHEDLSSMSPNHSAEQAAEEWLVSAP